MSASLVGSEMCIRDSSPRWPLASEVSDRLRRILAAARSCPSRATVFHAVSYTHLTLPTICSV
eukprot:12170717-Alexandrium_andersonii.AAC.1